MRYGKTFLIMLTAALSAFACVFPWKIVRTERAIARLSRGAPAERAAHHLLLTVVDGIQPPAPAFTSEGYAFRFVRGPEGWSASAEPISGRGLFFALHERQVFMDEDEPAIDLEHGTLSRAAARPSK